MAKRVGAEIIMLLPEVARPYYYDKDMLWTAYTQIVKHDDGTYTTSINPPDRRSGAVHMLFKAEGDLHFKGINTPQHFMVLDDWQNIRYYGEGWCVEGKVVLDDLF